MRPALAASTALAISLTALAACGEGPRVEPQQHLPAPSTPKLTVFVSNQSFDLDPVDIRVMIDNQLAISGDFVVDGQHTWVEFELDVDPGTHTLRVTSADAGAPLEQSFEMDDRKWGVINFWYDQGGSEPTPAHFSWSLLDEAPVFL